MTRYFMLHKSSIATQAIRCKAETAIKAANAIAKKLFKQTNKTKISMSLRETTRDSKKRIYSYIGTNYNNQIKIVSNRKSKGGGEEVIQNRTFIIQDSNGMFLRNLPVQKNNKFYDYTDNENDATLWVAVYSGKRTNSDNYLYNLHVYPYEQNLYDILNYDTDVLNGFGHISNIRLRLFICDYDRGYFQPFSITDARVLDDVKLKIVYKDPL
jgi:hypothetical protein